MSGGVASPDPWTAQSFSVVVPVFNEEDNAEPLVVGIVEAVRPLGVPFEVVVVDDGSSDRTLSVLRDLVERTVAGPLDRLDPALSVLHCVVLGTKDSPLMAAIARLGGGHYVRAEKP